MTYINEGPAWFHSPVKFAEDDAHPPDGETVPQAWRRLYGMEINEEVLVEVYDAGDCEVRLFESGRILVSGILSEIREISPDSPRPTRGPTITPIFDPSDVRMHGLPDEERDAELRRMTRKHLSEHIEEELAGGEHIMKEIWEETTSDAERKIVKETLRSVLDFLDDDDDDV
jgi:hypothetical protein